MSLFQPKSKHPNDSHVDEVEMDDVNVTENPREHPRIASSVSYLLEANV